MAKTNSPRNRSTVRTAARDTRGSRETRGAPDLHAASVEPRGRASAGDCRAQLAELFAYLDGELSASRCRTIERHLQACACCDTLASSVRRAIAVCRGAGRERLPDAVRARAQTRIRQLLGSAPLPRGRGTRRR